MEQAMDFTRIKQIEVELDNVMELTDAGEVKIRLKEVEDQFNKHQSEINKVRLGIIYHETALNLSFLAKSEYKGYAKKSFDILNELFHSTSTKKELMPFIASYRASALSLVGAETKKLKLVGEAFTLFADAVGLYAGISYLPEFLRGSVAENLPWIFFSKKKFAKIDFGSIINKQEKNPDYANWKIMSFTYWAWAKQHQQNKYRKQAVAYLERAISLDPDYKAGRRKAEELLGKLRR